MLYGRGLLFQTVLLTMRMWQKMYKRGLPFRTVLQTMRM